MTGFQMDQIRAITSKLFVGDTFDHFLVKEAEIITFNRFSIDGHLRKEFYTAEEREEMGMKQLSTWAMITPFCFSLIKGRRLPESFRIVLKLPQEKARDFLETRELPIRPEQLEGLYLNIRYENGGVVCLTGTSLNFFTLDKTVEEQWAEEVKEFFKRESLELQEI